MENNVPFAVSEGTQVRHERTVKRLIIALIIAVILIFASNAIWLYAWTQYDYTDTETTIEQRTDEGGNANYIGNNGDINNGLPESNSTETNTNAP
jgi:Tfp pilus assembly protein PilW